MPRINAKRTTNYKLPPKALELETSLSQAVNKIQDTKPKPLKLKPDDLKIYTYSATFQWTISNDGKENTLTEQVEGPKVISDTFVDYMYNVIYHKIFDYVDVGGELSTIISVECPGVPLVTDVFRRKLGLQPSNKKLIQFIDESPREEPEHPNLLKAQTKPFKVIIRESEPRQPSFDQEYAENSSDYPCGIRALLDYKESLQFTLDYQAWKNQEAASYKPNNNVVAIINKINVNNIRDKIGEDAYHQGMQPSHFLEVIGPWLKCPILIVNKQRQCLVGKYSPYKTSSPVPTLVIVQEEDHCFIEYSTVKQYTDWKEWDPNVMRAAFQPMNEFATVIDMVNTTERQILSGTKVRTFNQISLGCRHCGKRIKNQHKLKTHEEECFKSNTSSDILYKDITVQDIPNLNLASILESSSSQKSKEIVFLVQEPIPIDCIKSIILNLPVDDPQVEAEGIKYTHCESIRFYLGVQGLKKYHVSHIQFCRSPVDVEANRSLNNLGFRGIPSNSNVVQWLKMKYCKDMIKSTFVGTAHEQFIRFKSPSLSSNVGINKALDPAKVSKIKEDYKTFDRAKQFLNRLKRAKCPYSIYFATDRVEAYDGHDINNEVPGWYYIKTNSHANLTPNSSGWYVTSVLTKLKDMRIPFEVILQYRPSRCLPVDYFEKMVIAIYQAVGPKYAKSIINTFIGTLEKKYIPQKSRAKLFRSKKAYDTFRYYAPQSPSCLIRKHELVPFNDKGLGVVLAFWVMPDLPNDQNHALISFQIKQETNIDLIDTFLYYASDDSYLLYTNVDGLTIYHPRTTEDRIVQVDGIETGVRHEPGWLTKVNQWTQRKNFENIMGKYEAAANQFQFQID